MVFIYHKPWLFVVICDLYLPGGFQNIFIGVQTCSGFGIRIFRSIMYRMLGFVGICFRKNLAGPVVGDPDWES